MNPTTPPDPESLSTLATLYQHGAWIPLVILLSYFALRLLSTKVAWFTQGKRAAYVAAALGALATLVGPASQGTTPNASMLVAAVVSALTLLTSPAAAARAGAMLVFVALGALTLGGGTGCHNTIATAEVNAAKTAAADAWDCTKQEYQAVTAGKSWAQSALAVALQFVELVAKDGADPIAIAEDLARTYGAPVVACTMAELRGAPPAAAAAGSGAGSSSPMVSAARGKPSARAAAAVIAAKKWHYR